MPKLETTTKVPKTKTIYGKRYYAFGPPGTANVIKSLKKAKKLKDIIQLGVGYDRRQKVHLMKVPGSKDSYVIYRRGV